MALHHPPQRGHWWNFAIKSYLTVAVMQAMSFSEDEPNEADDNLIALKQASLPDEHAFFPRTRISYERELGRGWFGPIMAGNAQGIGAVVVKILKEDATPGESQEFLKQVDAYRELRHPNLLQLVACCLEEKPLLLMLENCQRGDLKSGLLEDPAFN